MHRRNAFQYRRYTDCEPKRSYLQPWMPWHRNRQGFRLPKGYDRTEEPCIPFHGRASDPSRAALPAAPKSFRTFDTEASGLIVLVRTYLNPYEDIAQIDMEKVLISVQRLREIQIEMKTLSQKIKNLESEFE